jgi:hypothetical protein
MTIARKLVLVAGLATSALALSAGTATAQESEVEVVEEIGHIPCDACPIHITGETQFRNEAGNVITSCEDEFEGTINADGSGVLNWVGGPHGGPGCFIVNCAGTEADWPTSDIGEFGNGEEHLWIRFCLSAGGNENHCDAEIHIEDESLHHYVLSLTNQECPAGPTGEGHVFISGQWEIGSDEEHPPLELEHHDN